MISKLTEKLKDREYRKAFVASQINVGIPFQIRGLLKSHPGWTQATLAERAGMLQPRISGLMTPGKVRPNIETLRRIAEAFDCGLIVRFAPFSELARWSEEFDPDEFYVPEFANDTGFVERRPIRSETPCYVAAQAVGTETHLTLRNTEANTSFLETNQVGVIGVSGTVIDFPGHAAGQTTPHGAQGAT